MSGKPIFSPCDWLSGSFLDLPDQPLQNVANLLVVLNAKYLEKALSS